ncbi:hypothetical protein AEBR_1094 [Halarcobacter ebronensis]|uniref:GGDEF domain-containing protein n=2 Tax=Halarcobacter ebronensis TaxID=1462615 RepID=A0A4Q1AQE9_9BACT|nr:hypothetical protein AEBR_1094 [Halarcobacter ebronensis]RXK05518.1 hypothetical protein CRV07_08380 [Halarcobacter ebronensis]
MKLLRVEMKDKLKKITDLTINELLPQEIILPSNYFQCFDKHAKMIDIDLKDEKFEKDINEVLINEFAQIDKYVKDASVTIQEVELITQDAQEAIKNKDESALKVLYKQINTLKSELNSMTENIYKDHLTKFYNKKWLYHKMLNEQAKFKKTNIVMLINIQDYEYIVKTYNKFIADNLILYIITYMNDKLKDESLEFEIVRFLNDKFLIIFDDIDINLVKSLANSISNILYDTVLKSHSGVFLKPKFNYCLEKVNKNESFHELLDDLYKKIIV